VEGKRREGEGKRRIGGRGRGRRMGIPHSLFLA